MPTDVEPVPVVVAAAAAADDIDIDAAEAAYWQHSRQQWLQQRRSCCYCPSAGETESMPLPWVLVSTVW